VDVIYVCGEKVYVDVNLLPAYLLQTIMKAHIIINIQNEQVLKEVTR
jgi:hypothetical protein